MMRGIFRCPVIVHLWKNIHRQISSLVNGKVMELKLIKHDEAL